VMACVQNGKKKRKRSQRHLPPTGKRTYPHKSRETRNNVKSPKSYWREKNKKLTEKSGKPGVQQKKRAGGEFKVEDQ